MKRFCSLIFAMVNAFIFTKISILCFLILLSFSSLFSLLGSEWGYLLISRKNKLPIIKKLSPLLWSIFLMVIGCLALLITVTTWPSWHIPKDFFTSIFWGSQPLLLDLPLYLGIIISLPGVLNAAGKEEILQIAIKESISGSEDPVLLYSYLKDENYAKYKNVILDRFARLLKTNKLQNSEIIEFLLSNSNKGISLRMIQVMPKNRLDLLLKKIEMEKDISILMAMIERLSGPIKNGKVRPNVIESLVSHTNKKIRLKIVQALPNTQHDILVKRLREEKDTEILLEIAKILKDWQTLRDLYYSESSSSIKESIESAMIEACKGKLDAKEALTLIEDQKIPLSLKGYAISLIDQASLWDVVNKSPELMHEGIKAIKTVKQMLQFILWDSTPLDIRKTLTARLSDRKALMKLVMSANTPEIRQEALKNCAKYGCLLEIATVCPHLDVLNWIAQRIKNEEILEAILKREDLKDLIDKAEQSKMQALQELVHGDKAQVAPTFQITQKHLGIVLVDSQSLSDADFGYSSFQDAIQNINSQNDTAAKSCFKEALKKGLNSLLQGYAHTSLGEIYLRENNIEKAMDEFFKVLNFKEGLYESVHSSVQYLSIIYRELNKPEAIEILEQLKHRTSGNINTSLSSETVKRVQQLTIKNKTFLIEKEVALSPPPLNNPDEAKHIKKFVKADKKDQDAPKSDSIVKKAIKDLIIECEWHIINASQYQNMKAEFERRENNIIRPIGEKLHKEGGLTLMRKVYQEVEKVIIVKYQKGCDSALSMKWGRIGDWRS